MKNIKYIIGLFLFAMVIITSCKEDTFELGDLIAPTNIAINTDIVGSTDVTPDGDGSGVVLINITADNAITYHIGYNKIEDYGDVNFSLLPAGIGSKKFTDPGTNTYRISVVAYGTGGMSSNLTKDITVRSDFVPNPEIVTALTSDNSKAWIVDKSVAGHFGVGPWSNSSVTPEWWGAAVNEKEACCSCFYTATFTFTKSPSNSFTLTVDAPDGAFTKTGALANIPGIPSTGDEGCYSEYSGGSSGFNFIPASTGISEGISTQTSIKLGDNNTYIGYGSLLDEYEILEINPNYMYLRVQGTETGNAWYIKLIPAQ
jgi:hypothetical protein